MIEAGLDQELRDRMVDGLVERGAVADPRVVEALRAVPRHVFVPAVSAEQAYEDRAVVTRFEDGRPSSSASQRGADPARGSGLTGLSDRVAALGGRARIVSPPGWGTSVRVELPCDSS